MNSLSEIKKRSATLHGGGYFTPGGSRTEAANDVQFLLEKLEEMTGWRNECGFRYNAEKEKTAKLRAALADCLQMSPLDPFERGQMIQRVLTEAQ